MLSLMGAVETPIEFSVKNTVLGIPDSSCEVVDRCFERQTRRCLVPPSALTWVSTSGMGGVPGTKYLLLCRKPKHEQGDVPSCFVAMIASLLSRLDRFPQYHELRAAR